MLYEDLVHYEESRPFEERTSEFPGLALSRSFGTSETYVDAAWKITPLIMHDANLKLAAQFLSESQDNFFVWPGGMDEAIGQSAYVPKSVYEQVRFENALQNAFKAIEAVIGNPPKSDIKFFQTIKEIGLDPSEEFGLNDLPLNKVIRKMSIARDKKSAHGSTKDRNISVGELLDYQFCARLIVITAFEKQLDTSIYC